MTLARRFQTRVGIALEVGADLVVDGNMEAVGVANWTASAGTATKSAESRNNGAQTLNLVTPASGTVHRVSQTIVVTAATRYRLAGWLRNVDATKVSVSAYDATGAALIFDQEKQEAGVTFVFFTREFTTPAGCISLRIDLNVHNPGTAVNGRFDDITLHKIAYGTGVNPGLGIPVDEVSEAPTYEVKLDKALRGVASVDFKSLQGVGRTEVTFSGAAYPEEVGYLLRLIMGMGNTVYNGTVYTHTFELFGFPESLTFESDVVTGASGGRRFTGLRLTNLTLNFSGAEGLLAYSATAISKISTKVTTQNPAATDNSPWQGWRGTVTSTGHTTRIISGEISLARESYLEYVSQNSQDVKDIVLGALEVSGNLVLAADDLTDFDNFLAHLNQSFQIVFTQGSGATEKTITILATALSFADGPMTIDRGNQGILFTLPIRGIYNTTNRGPIKVTLVNARSSYDT